MTFPTIPANGSAGYNLTRSLRFRASASAYLNRTPASAGNRQKYTWSGWVKRGSLSSFQTLFMAGPANTNRTQLMFLDNDTLVIFYDGGTRYGTVSSGVFRDPSSWYHIVLSVDTTNATAANRMILYVNGVSISQTSYLNGYIPQNTNTDINNTTAHFISKLSFSSDYLDGYLAEVNFIDGQALTPSSFGSTNTLTGVWQPARYTGTYGTNGFYLPFTDNSGATATTIGKDFSGNGNNWTPNNISVTAGVTYDSMTDVPTLTSATAANFAVLNPLNNSGTLANANLTWNGTDKAALGTMALPITGKYYFEATCTTVGNFSIIGIADGQAASFNGVLSSANFRTYNSGGEKADSTRTASWGSTFTSGDVIGIAVDMDNGAIYFAKNNTWQASGVPTSGASKTGAAFTDLISSGKTWVAFVSSTNNNGVWNANHGQRPFAYTPPTGFVALNTFNLPTSTIVNGAKEMGILLYTGDGTTSKDVTGLSFQPDLTYVKNRSAASDPTFSDTLRGITKVLYTDATSAESTAPSFGYINSILSTGFNVNSGGGTEANFNKSGQNYVGWTWKVGQGSSSTNTSGSITSTISLNASAGLSMVTYTGTGANATVGHGLGVAPQFIIVKNRNGTFTWRVYHSSIGNGNVLLLNGTDASTAEATAWNNTTPTSSVFSVGTSNGTNGSTSTYVAYCWTPIAGFSAFGIYTGNGSADGPFVYTGFRPKFVMIKASSTTGSWNIIDTARDTYNLATKGLFANLSDAEDTTRAIDIVSNGFKIRSSTITNTNSATYIYMAYAENPFKNALAR